MTPILTEHVIRNTDVHLLKKVDCAGQQLVLVTASASLWNYVEFSLLPKFQSCREN